MSSKLNFIMIIVLISCNKNIYFLSGSENCVTENTPRIEKIYISNSIIKNLPSNGKFHDIFIKYEKRYNNKKIYEIDKLQFLNNFFIKNNIPTEIIDVDTLKVKHNYLLISKINLEYNEYLKARDGKNFFEANCFVQLEFQKENCKTKVKISFIDKEEEFFYPLNGRSLRDALNEFKKGILEIIRMYK